MTKKIAILGASGYTGAELVRLIATHPEMEIVALTADRKAGMEMGAVFPHLRHLGCNAATGQYPIRPLLRAGLIDPDEIIIDMMCGVSGAGRSPKEGMLHSEVSEGIHAYGLPVHRHTSEFDQEFKKEAGRAVKVTFTPHLMPANRGILATCHLRGEAEAVHACLAETYKDEPFIVVLPLGEAPATRHVRGSNYCHIGVIGDRIEGRVRVISALDNLVKGSSGQALQNANLLLGLPETMGLEAAMWPARGGGGRGV